jgi:hypothetical protein
MLDLTALEVALGLGFVYLVFSLVISRVNEAVAGVLQWRSKALEAGLHQLLTGRRKKEDLADVRAEAATEDAGRMFDDLLALSGFDHPLLSNLRQPRVITGRLRNPSYVAPQTFSLAVLSILAPERQPNVEAVRVTNRIRSRVHALPARRRALADELLDLLPEEGSALSAGDLEQVRRVLDRTRQLTDAQKRPFRDLLARLERAPDAPLAQVAAAVEQLPDALRKPLAVFVRDATGDLERFRGNLERWFDDAMGRVSGFYKRKVQLAVLAYAILITAALNLDSVAFATRLWTDDLVRSAAVAAAERQQQQEQDPGATRLLEEVRGLDLPLGWSAADPLRDAPSGPAGWLLKLLGLAVTVLALSLGAPFWFDLLSRVARLRSTGPPPPPASASEARPQPS